MNCVPSIFAPASTNFMEKFYYKSLVWRSCSFVTNTSLTSSNLRLKQVSIGSDSLCKSSNPPFFLKFPNKYGKKIFDKLNAAMNPEFEDEKPLNPFDMWSGANFKLKIRKADGYQNYDKSEFEAPSAVNEDDDLMEKMWKSEYPLLPFIDRKEFKSYADIKARLNKVLMLEGTPAPSMHDRDEMWGRDEAPAPRAATPKAIPKAPAPKSDLPWDEQEDDDMAMFQRLASE
jgi:hypothetical protein